MQLTQASLACDNEKLTEILDEKLEYEAVPDPIEQWPWQYVRSGIPVSHPQMCMHAAEMSDCDGPLPLEVHASPPATTPAANTNPTAIQALFIARLLHQSFRIGKVNWRRAGSRRREQRRRPPPAFVRASGGTQTGCEQAEMRDSHCRQPGVNLSLRPLPWLRGHRLPRGHGGRRFCGTRS